MTNYKTFSNRIRRAKTIEDLIKLESSLDRLYNAGVFSVNQLQRLDLLIVDSKIKLGL